MSKPGQHRHADRQADEMAGAQERERERDVVAAGDAEPEREEPWISARRRCAWR